MTDVRTQSAEAAALSADAPLIDALLGGTKAMRAAGKAHLPQWPNEDKDAYAARLAVATLFPAYGRTVEILAAKPFSKPLTIGKDVPARMLPWLEDIDKAGRNLHSFASSACEAALGHGFCGILVDYPVTRGLDGKQLLTTLAEEKAAGVRPHFIQIKNTQILGWLPKAASTLQGLDQLRILETYSEPNGDFDTKESEQVRVLGRGTWATYRKVKHGSTDEWLLHESGTTSLKTIPFVPVYGLRLGYMMARPPLLDLAYANVEHWQTKSDRQNALHVLSVPILFAKMIDDAVITVGAGSAVKAGDPSADMKYVEISGAAVEAGRKVLLDLEDQMRQAGAELLVIKPGGASVAQTLSDNEQGTCALQKIAQNVEDAIDQALQIAADWVGEPQGGHVELYSDYGAATLAEASAEILLKAVSAGKMSDESFHEELQRRGIRSPDVTWEMERARIDAQGPALGVIE